MFLPSDFKEKKACVIGLGNSGSSAARLLQKQGFQLLMSDSRPFKEIQALAQEIPQGIPWEADGPSPEALSCGFAVKSPGLSWNSPVIQKIKNAGIPIFSEMEVALSFSKTKQIIAITGTNGKTTTTALTGEIFRQGLSFGQNVYVCGNIGNPVSNCILEANPQDFLVIESSSYQLEDSNFFHPQIAAILNIQPDHIDHHGSFENYIRAKARIFREQGPLDFCIFNSSDFETIKLARECPAQKLFFGGDPKSSHAWTNAGKIYARLNLRDDPVSFTPPALPGRHNQENAMAAILIALASKIPASSIQKALAQFKGVEHRLEEAGTYRKIRCVNDSKATNVDSTLVALKAFSEAHKKIILILGGLDKGSPYTPLKPLISQLAKAVLTIGTAAEKIESELDGVVPLSHCENLDKAVQRAFEIGEAGDILLLSPACASFDQFKNFEERGKRFKKILENYQS